MAVSILALVTMGVPLPFVSYGMLTLFIGVCILVSAQAHGKLAHS